MHEYEAAAEAALKEVRISLFQGSCSLGLTASQILSRWKLNLAFPEALKLTSEAAICWRVAAELHKAHKLKVLLVASQQ